MPISVMLKPASGNCNLRCEYCFYHDLAATRQTENKGYMTRDTALQVMDKALAFAGDGPVYFTFQGGEPLLAGKDFFRFFFSSCKERQRPRRDRPVLRADQRYFAGRRMVRPVFGIWLFGGRVAGRRPGGQPLPGVPGRTQLL